MEVQFKKKFPKGALSFYIELYIRRKCATEKKCSQQEAMKSWISLNKSEKQFFETKYQEFRSNFNKSIGMRLKNAEPYMKLKEVIPTNKNSSQNVSDNNEEINKETNQNELVFSKIEVDDNEEPMPSTQNEENAELDLHDYYLDVSGSPIPTTQDEVVSIPEPIPPKIMRGKDLFVIIKEREQNDLVWEELTKPQKRLYINAALEIKKNYLKQYREYLDHLSPEKLFNHYRNIVNSVGIYD